MRWWILSEANCLTDSAHPTGVQFKWTSPRTWKTRQFYLFISDTFIKMTCKRIYCVPSPCQQKLWEKRPWMNRCLVNSAETAMSVCVY